jgi:hypothetical protein
MSSSQAMATNLIGGAYHGCSYVATPYLDERVWGSRHAARGTLASSAHADDARDVLKAMSDFMAKQQDFSFSYEATIEAVSNEFEKLQFVSSDATCFAAASERSRRTGQILDQRAEFLRK